MRNGPSPLASANSDTASHLDPTLPVPPAAAARLPCPHCARSYSTRANLLHHMRADHAGDQQPSPTAFLCECGKTFDTLRSRAAHRQACAIWQALHPADQRPQAQPPMRSIESVPHLLACPAMTGLRHRHDIIAEDNPPPLTDALREHKWIAFLRDALALLPPPASSSEEAHH